jgi:hypothetical protein
MARVSWELADELAIALVNRETDVNEVQKVATHARVVAERSPEKVGERFFSLLNTMTRDGRYLVRSGRTLDYYRDLREVCERVLRDYRVTTAERGWELVSILGWAARLIRYYNTDEGAKEIASRPAVGSQTQGKQIEQGQWSGQQAQVRSSTTSSTHQSSTSAPKLKPVARPTPVRTEIVRETVTLLTAARVGKARVQTSQGEEISCTGLPSYPSPEIGEVCRADVTRENGRAIKSAFKGWAT